MVLCCVHCLLDEMCIRDRFQEGCLWLCKAAFTYHAGQAQFSTYAKKVVKNGLLSYCRKICSQGRHISRLSIGDQGELAADGEQLEQPDDHFDSHLSRCLLYTSRCV